MAYAAGALFVVVAELLTTILAGRKRFWIAFPAIFLNPLVVAYVPLPLSVISPETRFTLPAVMVATIGMAEWLKSCPRWVDLAGVATVGLLYATGTIALHRTV